MWYHIVFEGIHFVLAYFTQRWNAYVARNLSKIQNGKNEACLYERQNTFNYFENINQRNPLNKT